MHSGLATDLYELTMAAGYWSAGMMEEATFELFVRRLPSSRGYLLVAGLEQALDYLEAVSFAAEDRAWLKGQPQFSRIDARFFDDYLGRFRFTGDVWAVPEGTAIFANEPIVRVTAPLPEAQIVETALLASVLFPTSVATKAARLLTAAGGRPVVDFGVRRAHGLAAARPVGRSRRGTGRLRGRLCGNVVRRGVAALRHPGVGDDGPFVGAVVCGRDRGVPHVRADVRPRLRLPARHLRHARRRDASDRRASRSGDGAPRQR